MTSGAATASLDPARLADAAARLGFWHTVQVVPSAGSTNAELLAAAAGGAPEGLVLAAERQTAGRGRRGREWHAPPGEGLTFSVLLRPAVPAARWPFLPLLAGLAVAEALSGRVPSPRLALKWPNDLLLDGGKVAGVLAESDGRAVVVGIGLNVNSTAAALPPGASSLRLAAPGDAPLNRTGVLADLLAGLAGRYRQWCQAGGGGAELLAAYRRRCATIGQPVRVQLPDGAALHGIAEDVDDVGRLVLCTSSGSRAITAGDVVHLRTVAAATGAAAHDP